MTPLSKQLVIALAISGALNLLAIGLFVGGVIKRSRHDGPARVERRDRDRDRDRDREKKRTARDEVPGEEEREERRPDGERRRGKLPLFGLTAEEPQLLARRVATADARKAVREALEKEPFDAAALERSLATLRTETAATQDLLHKTVLNVATKGDEKKREDLARAFERFGGGP
jgi:uncharacterized membrane protein